MATKRNKQNIFQKDEDGNLLVPAEQFTGDVVQVVSECHVKANKPPVSEEVRLKRIEQGKKLGAIRREKCNALKAEKERVVKEREMKEEEDRKLELEAHKKEVERKILEGKLVKIKIKETKPRAKKQVTEKPARKSNITVESDTETETDMEEPRKVAKKAIKTVKAIEAIDNIINSQKDRYTNRILASMSR